MPSKPLSRRVPRLTVAQTRAVDRYAIEQLAIPGVVLMENAGRNAADLIERWGRSRIRGQDCPLRRVGDARHRPLRVAILCGRGNNGGDGFVVARHLSHRGHQVAVDLTADPSRLSGDAATNHAIVARMGIPIRLLSDAKVLASAARRWPRCDVLVDALLGTGFTGQVREPLASIIRRVNGLAGPLIVAIDVPSTGPLIVAIDVPSGLDADTGQPGGAAIRADRTITFVAAKTGYARPSARPYLGRLSVVDIGAPTRLILARLGASY